MEASYIKSVLEHEGIDVDPKDIPWIQYLLKPIEPIISGLTPEYMDEPSVTRPWVFQQITFSWENKIR